VFQTLAKLRQSTTRWRKSMEKKGEESTGDELLLLFSREKGWINNLTESGRVSRISRGYDMRRKTWK